MKRCAPSSRRSMQYHPRARRREPTSRAVSRLPAAPARDFLQTRRLEPHHQSTHHRTAETRRRRTRPDAIQSDASRDSLPFKRAGRDHGPCGAGSLRSASAGTALCARGAGGRTGMRGRRSRSHRVDQRSVCVSLQTPVRRWRRRCHGHSFVPALRTSRGIRVSGPRDRKREALAALELIADNYLSVGTPVQVALPELLRIAPRVREAISARTRANLDALRSAIRAARSANALPVEGGWSAVVRLPRIESDEDFAVRLITSHGVFVHPGYFFDFPGDGYLVLSLLTPEKEFEEGVRRIVGIIPA